MRGCQLNRVSKRMPRNLTVFSIGIGVSLRFRLGVRDMILFLVKITAFVLATEKLRPHYCLYRNTSFLMLCWKCSVNIEIYLPREKIARSSAYNE